MRSSLAICFFSSFLNLVSSFLASRLANASCLAIRFFSSFLNLVSSFLASRKRFVSSFLASRNSFAMRFFSSFLNLVSSFLASRMSIFSSSVSLTTRCLGIDFCLGPLLTVRGNLLVTLLATLPTALPLHPGPYLFINSVYVIPNKSVINFCSSPNANILMISSVKHLNDGLNTSSSDLV